MIFPLKLLSESEQPEANASDYIKVSGSAGISTEFSSTNAAKHYDALRRKYNSDFQSRANALININLFNQIELPFEIWLTSSQVSFQQPFNQFGVNPKIGKWLVLHGGYFYSRLSDLTYGDARMLGGGAEVNWKNFKFALLYGYTKEFNKADTSIGYYGDYSRTALALKFGYGNESFYSYFNFIKSSDDTSKKLNIINAPLAKENMAASINFGFPVTQYAKFSSECAVSVFTNDRKAKAVSSNDIPDFLKSIFNANYSSQVDAAVTAGLIVTPIKYFNFKLNAKWIGPGYQSLGYPNLQNDVLDLVFAPNISLLKGDLTIRASLGTRTNNLRNNRLAATERTIVSSDVFSRISDIVSISAQYSNYGMRTNYRRDTLRFQNIASSASISPQFTYQWLGAVNNLNLSYSYQDIDDKSSYDTSYTNNRSNGVNLTYSFTFPSTLSLITSMFYNKNKSLFSSEIISVNESVGYVFFDGKLNTNISLGITRAKTISSDTQLTARLAAAYSLNKYGSFSINLSNMNYNSGSTGAEIKGIQSYNELQGSIQYNVSFY